MSWIAPRRKKISEVVRVLSFIVVTLFANQIATPMKAQSIGYHPNLFLGFNPYLSPVFGYGLGLPYGAYSPNSLKQPLISDSVLGSSYGSGIHNWISKIHAKTLLKKYALHQPYQGSFKNKITLSKHPEYAFTPYGADYGLGKHYGSAVIPNNPYKSAYGDYYNDPAVSKLQASKHGSLDSPYQHSNELAQASTSYGEYVKPNSLIKPLIKVGALITTAALLGKKTLDPAIKLNPAGMIINGRGV